MKVHVDKNLCIGCSVCSEIASGSFVMNGDKAEETNSSDLNDKKVQNEVKLARDVCPVQAIIVEED